jgi:hypothetical protein
VEQLGVQVNDRTAVASAYAARRVGVEEPTNRLAVAFAELALVVEEPTPSRASACLAIGYRDKSPGGAHGDRVSMMRRKPRLSMTGSRTLRRG